MIAPGTELWSDPVDMNVQAFDTLAVSLYFAGVTPALTVNTDRGIVKLIEHGPPHTLTTFRILKVATSDVCGKYGWILNGATFCTATQGVGTLDWHGHEFDCDQADTE